MSDRLGRATPFVAIALAWAAVVLLGLAVGAVFGDEAARWWSIALYLLGGLIGIMGLAGGLRRSLRPRDQRGIEIHEDGTHGRRRLFTVAEVNDAMAMSTFLLGLGLLVLLGAVIVDPRATLW